MIRFLVTLTTVFALLALSACTTTVGMRQRTGAGSVRSTVSSDGRVGVGADQRLGGGQRVGVRADSRSGAQVRGSGDAGPARVDTSVDSSGRTTVGARGEVADGVKAQAATDSSGRTTVGASGEVADGVQVQGEVQAAP